jgi:hypothetical protein
MNLFSLGAAGRRSKKLVVLRCTSSSKWEGRRGLAEVVS